MMKNVHIFPAHLYVKITYFNSSYIKLYKQNKTY